MSTFDTSGLLGPSELKTIVAETLDDDKAIDVAVIDLSGKSALADYIVVASGTSSRHIMGMADRLKNKLSTLGHKGMRIEGADRADWVILDAGDIIIHLFRPEVREFYNIEKMWGAPNLEAVAEAVADEPITA